MALVQGGTVQVVRSGRILYLFPGESPSPVALGKRKQERLRGTWGELRKDGARIAGEEDEEGGEEDEEGREDGEGTTGSRARDLRGHHVERSGRRSDCGLERREAP